VSVKPVVPASIASVNTGSLPSTISAILTWNGTAGATLSYSTTVVRQQVEVQIRLPPLALSR
jgi:hypothetical protein